MALIKNLDLPIITVERNTVDSNIPSGIQLGNFSQHHGCAIVLFENKQTNNKYKVFLKRSTSWEDFKWCVKILSLGLRVGALGLSKFYTSKDDFGQRELVLFSSELVEAFAIGKIYKLKMQNVWLENIQLRSNCDNCERPGIWSKGMKDERNWIPLSS